MPSDLFISYARKDNVQGFVSALHDALEADYQTFVGRPIEAFLDLRDIVLFDDWRGTILEHLRSSRLFLACLSPSYFASDPCRWEWAEWIKHELARGHYGNGIATIYFVEPETLSTTDKAQAVAWMEDLQRRHGISFAPWFPGGQEALQRAEARERLHQVACTVRNKLDLLDLASNIPGNLDAANPGFVGRLSELAQLHQKVHLGPVGVTTAVQGLGGMGKTALALHYAHAYAREYPGGRWQLRCAGQHDLATVLTQINQTLQLSWTEAESKDTRLQAERVLRECERKGHTLLLLDNVDSPALLSTAQTSALLKGDWLHTLFTTRLPKSDFPGLPASSEFLTLDRLDPLDALQLLRQHQPNQAFSSPEEERAAAEIIEALGGLTLALETAAIYLGQHASQIKPSAYLQRLRKDLLSYHDAKAQQVEGAVRHGAAEVTATLRPTLETLSPAAQTILALAGMCAPDAVVLPWLREVAGKHHPELLTPPEIGDLDPWTEVIARLIGLRLLTPTEEPHVLTMHRVLQDAVLRCHERPVEELATQLHEHVTSRAQFLWEGWVQHEHRWEIQPLAATTESWMTHSADIGRELAGQVMGPLMHLMQRSKAESLLLAALETFLPDQLKPIRSIETLTCELEAVPDHPHVAPLLNNLAEVLEAKGRFTEASLLLKRALAINESTLGINHHQTAITQCNLATLLMHMNLFQEAQTLSIKSVHILEASLGIHHPIIATALAKLASVCMRTGRMDKAESFLRRAIAIHETSSGPDHPSVANSIGTLVELLYSTSRRTEAEQLTRRALAIDEKCFGPDHPAVARDLNNLAQMLHSSGRFTEAEELMRRALMIDEDHHGPEHEQVARDLTNLAQLLKATKRLGEAEPLMRRAIMVYQHFYGPDHPKVATSLSNLAVLLKATNRIAEAEPLIRRALSIDEASHGPDSPEVARDLNNFAQLLKAKGQFDQAEQLFRRVALIFLRFTSRTKHLHPHLPIALKNYAGLVAEMSGDDEVSTAILSLGAEAEMSADLFEQILSQVFSD